MSILVVFIFIILTLLGYVFFIKRKFGKEFKLMQSNIEQLQKFQEENIEVEAILQIIQDGVIITDLNNQIKLVSQKAAAILRSEVSDLKEQHIETILPVADLKDKFNIDLTTELKLQDGEIISATVKSSPIISHEKLKGIVYIIHDKTQEKIFNEMKLDFVAMAAHQLRTPLTTLRGYLSLLSQSVMGKLSEEEKLSMERSLKGVDKLSSLIEYLINATRIGESKLTLNLKLSSLELLISEVITEFENFASEKGITISFEKPERQLPEVMIDPNLIGIVLDNLIINAIEHSFSKKISVRVNEHAEEFVVEVQDYGRGVPSFASNYLFTKFYKVPSQLTATPGKGLGLYVSKLIIEAHHGKIWANSVYGRGSIFSFTLPKAKNQPS